MPFKNLQEAAAGDLESPTPDLGTLEYTRSLPEPLMVSILDSPLEREGRTTAAVSRAFLYDHPASGARIVVPVGYITDFASIPPVARMAFPPFGRHAKAAVLHDWLYAVGEPNRKWFADQVFRDAMMELQVDPERRDIMYQAVHLFGGGGYGRAETEWRSSWADWRTGERTVAPSVRADHFHARWPRAPHAGYGPS